MENGRMNDYTSADLMAAILSLHDATASGFAKADLKTDRLRDDMNRRFDHMDGRFDRLEGRVAALEPHDHSPAS
jgi:hypothetical protein